MNFNFKLMNAPSLTSGGWVPGFSSLFFHSPNLNLFNYNYVYMPLKLMHNESPQTSASTAVCKFLFLTRWSLWKRIRKEACRSRCQHATPRPLQTLLRTQACYVRKVTPLHHFTTAIPLDQKSMGLESDWRKSMEKHKATKIKIIGHSRAEILMIKNDKLLGKFQSTPSYRGAFLPAILVL